MEATLGSGLLRVDAKGILGWVGRSASLPTGKTRLWRNPWSTLHGAEGGDKSPRTHLHIRCMWQCACYVQVTWMHGFCYSTKHALPQVSRHQYAKHVCHCHCQQSLSFSVRIKHFHFHLLGSPPHFLITQGLAEAIWIKAAVWSLSESSPTNVLVQP